MPPEMNTGADGAGMEESVRTLLADLPAPVRAFVTSDRVDEIVTILGKKYQLHADQSGRFHQAFVFMLLGVYTPARFASALEDNNFPEETVEGILADLNERVFAPLRKAERETQKEAPSEAPISARAPLVPVPAPIEMPRSIVPQQATVPQVPATSAPLPTITAPLRSQTPISPTPTPAQPSMTAYMEPTMRTMAHDVEAMKDGQIPAALPYTLHAPSSIPTPASTQEPKLAIPAAPAPSPAPVVQATAPVTAPRAETPPPHPMRTFGTPDLEEVKSTLQKYGVDPYRETPE